MNSLEERVKSLEKDVEWLEEHYYDLTRFLDKIDKSIEILLRQQEKRNKQDAEIANVMNLLQSATYENSRKVDDIHKNFKGY